MCDHVIEFKLRQPHFNNMISDKNKKKVDARIFFDYLRRRLKTGCLLKFKLGKKFVLKKLLSFEPYFGFRDLLKTEGVRSCLPNMKDGDLNAAV